ncbi:hypothetical protein CHARACLAT_009816 [Characodon lateralis]|uniref:Uncharacterized protein n=1 Tax=Characodon lateralis TaxID=208331 RepID=A0ABU7DRC6_9TELE|nr:hypothetical protein [Characodon lateralis]
MQGQEGRVDAVPQSGGGWCPGLLTFSSASSSSLLSPSSPSRVRRGIKAQLLSGMQGGGRGRRGEDSRRNKQCAKSLYSDDTFTFLPGPMCLGALPGSAVRLLL